MKLRQRGEEESPPEEEEEKITVTACESNPWEPNYRGVAFVKILMRGGGDGLEELRRNDAQFAYALKRARKSPDITSCLICFAARMNRTRFREYCPTFCNIIFTYLPDIRYCCWLVGI